jgi:hypothetical protein
MAFKTLPRMQVQSTSVPQPAFGSWIASYGGSSSATIAPASSPITLTLGTATAASGIQDANGIFAPGPAWIINADGTGAEPVLIQSVSGNTVTLGPQTTSSFVGGINPVTTQTHKSGSIGTGSFLMLKLTVNDLTIMFEDGATGNFLYIGNAWNMAANLFRISKLAKVAANAQPYTWTATETSPGMPFDTSEIWILGTNTADYFVASAMM